jgi:drug/metabolite transporter (DMT)-like permease
MLALVFLLNALFYFVFPVGKVALQYSSPFFLIGIRMILGGVILLGYQFIFRRAYFYVKKQYIWALFLLALFNIYIANAYEFWGLQYMSSAKTSFIYNLSPFFAAFFSYLHFDERMNLKKWIGLMVSFLGFIPVWLSDSPAEQNLAHVGLISSAEWAVVFATVATVYGWTIMQKMVRVYQYDAVMANGVSMIGGGLMSLAHSMITEPWYPAPVVNWHAFFIWVMIMVLVSNITCYSLYGYLLKKYSAMFLTFTGLSGPLFAAFYDWAWFGISVSWTFYLATALVAAGMYLFYQEELQQENIIS